MAAEAIGRIGAAPNIGTGERIGSLLAGAGLILPALFRRSPGRIAAALGGAVLLQRGLTGHCAIYEKLGIDRSRKGSASRARRERDADPVSSASEDSFPASDPPAWTPVVGPGVHG